MKNGKLNGKVAVITGASKGIGAGIARQFAAEGAAVVVNYASSKEGADRVVDEISKRGGKAIAVQGDVGKKKDIERLFAEAKKSFGRIDILVNNAGAYDFKPLEEVTETEFHREFNTNVLGLLLATQEAAKHFGADGGSVINVSSVASSASAPALRPSPSSIRRPRCGSIACVPRRSIACCSTRRSPPTPTVRSSCSRSTSRGCPTGRS